MFRRKSPVLVASLVLGLCLAAPAPSRAEDPATDTEPPGCPECPECETCLPVHTFLNAYFSPVDTCGDFNRDGTHSVQDIFDYLADHFGNCLNPG